MTGQQDRILVVDDDPSIREQTTAVGYTRRRILKTHPSLGLPRPSRSTRSLRTSGARVLCARSTSTLGIASNLGEPRVNARR